MKNWTREERYRPLEDPEVLRPLHQRIAASDYRQRFHIQPVTGLLNDPNGFVWHQGEWHLFYQWCPWGAVHGLKHWYHLVSQDLVTWKNLGVCLYPDTEADNKGAYSGSALPLGEELYLYYTGNHRDPDWKRISYTCLADLRDKARPVKGAAPLFGPAPGYTEHQRDPKIIAREDGYYLVLGAQNLHKQGRVLVYRSQHPTKDWTFAGELTVPGYEDFGDMWECPSIERISGQDVLLFCPQHLKLPGRGDTVHHNGYILGEMDWASLTFTPHGQFHVLDFGFDSYAAECAAFPERDSDQGIIIAWMGLPDSAYPTDEEDWQGCLTLPRALTVRNRRLIQQPLTALKQLRLRELELPGGVPAEALPDACEIELIARGGDLELALLAREDGAGGVRITYDDSCRELTVDRSGMERRFNTEQGESRSRPLPKGLHHLRIYVDCSSVEIFVNDGDAVFTTRAFPTAREHRLRLNGDAALHLWELGPAVADDFVI